MVEAVEVIGGVTNECARGVVPGSRTDAIPSIQRIRALRAQVRLPRAAALTRSVGQHLAMGIGTRQPTKIGAVTEAITRDEESHRIFLRHRHVGRYKTATDHTKNRNNSSH
jgi:hypothetical protein